MSSLESDRLLQERFQREELGREEAFEEILRDQRHEALLAEIDHQAGERARAKAFSELILSIDETRASAAQVRWKAFREAQDSQELYVQKKGVARSAAFQSEMVFCHGQVMTALELQETQSSNWLDSRGPVSEHHRQHWQDICAFLKHRYEQQFHDILRPWVAVFHADFEVSHREREEEAARVIVECLTSRGKTTDTSAADVLHTLRTTAPMPLSGTSEGEQALTNTIDRAASGQEASPPPSDPDSLVSDEDEEQPANTQREDIPASLQDPPGDDVTVPNPGQNAGQGRCQQESETPPAGNEAAGPGGTKIALLSLGEQFQQSQANREQRFKDQEQEMEQRWVDEETTRACAGADRDAMFESKMHDSAHRFTQEMETYDKIFHAQQQARSPDDAEITFQEVLDEWQHHFEVCESRINASYKAMAGAQDDVMRAMQCTVDEVAERQIDWLDDARARQMLAFLKVACSLDPTLEGEESEWASVRHRIANKNRDRRAKRGDSMDEKTHSDSSSSEVSESDSSDGEMSGDGEAEEETPPPIAPMRAPKRTPFERMLKSMAGAERSSAPATGVAKVIHEQDHQKLFQESQEKMKMLFQKNMKKRRQEFTVSEASREHAFAQAQLAWRCLWRAQEVSQDDSFLDSQMRRAEDFQTSEAERRVLFRDAETERREEFLAYLQDSRKKFEKDQKRRQARWRRSEDARRSEFSSWEQKHVVQLEGMVVKYQGLFRADERMRGLKFEEAFRRKKEETGRLA
ncbi:hypothetical protein GLOTRDRAFT_97056 [Gloeophyllum trabeum ATCC 11539]|uniref:Uncharacterized protein n=1 Tax=Gloeophyllum trabeum (strain ATCC 11539 / FP-39264 / Madison 617) TaxID=670483 RepID=S7RDE0_GLOTA|nr:uncharacterized protein GLOTRDRAFT_97056 [Gloeophyllum trabeum ATCC 11539]EPQ50444.1 hypothetical protein GLOTRDRAFT_97056 [Gloeophyllum trabeum ATCC 11539]